MMLQGCADGVVDSVEGNKANLASRQSCLIDRLIIMDISDKLRGHLTMGGENNTHTEDEWNRSR